MLDGEAAADAIVAAHPVERIAGAAPAGEAEPRSLRLGEEIPCGAVAGRADDDHCVGEAGGDEIGAEIGGAFLERDEQVEAACRRRGGDAAEQREIKRVDRAAILAGAADGDERDRLAALEAERRGAAVDDTTQSPRRPPAARAP